MSDMSRPFPPPSPTDHERHDPLLVAQFVAGDPLGEVQQHEARQLVSACGACAALATDLRAISSAVAWEPMPTRRRDFRLGPEQAERLDGNPVTRLLRRFSVPRSGAFRPLAAGVMSIGLAFVVAGTVWPGGGSLSAPNDSAPTAELSETRVAATPSFPEAPAAREQADPGVGGTGEANAFMSQDSVEDAVEAGSAMKSSVSVPGTIDEARSAPDMFAEEVVDPAVVAEADTDAADTDAADTMAASQRSVPGADGTVAVAVTPLDGGLQMDALITLLGLALAVAGGLALLFAWLARRIEDPLLR